MLVLISFVYGDGGDDVDYVDDDIDFKEGLEWKRAGLFTRQGDTQRLLHLHLLSYNLSLQIYNILYYISYMTQSQML